MSHSLLTSESIPRREMLSFRRSRSTKENTDTHFFQLREKVARKWKEKAPFVWQRIRRLGADIKKACGLDVQNLMNILFFSRK